MSRKETSKTGPLSLDSGLVASGLLHGTSLACHGAGLLILGRSGTGKSSLALELMSRGALLVSDDQTQIDLVDGALMASAPATIRGLIEARGVGLLNAEYAGPTPLKFVVSLDHIEAQRLPYFHTISLLGVTLPLLLKVPYPHFAAAILQYANHGRRD
ncbi:HPr kinase/phosphatase C-terminal domain-containing protein [Cognatishimia sp. WU-CL00825]|uniref:HPr kinase/phosphorylase n=1 Tax=Cognatishimia sp. WU-CL00825 TaxID=3127658 RepID=UPI00310349AF